MRHSKVYFTDEELRCKKTKVVVLDPVFDLELTRLRIALAEPMIVNSCCRSRQYNEEIGGAPKSFHIYDYPAWRKLKGTAAIDIGFTKLFYRNKLARAAWQSGWRIGLSENFLHLDTGAISGCVQKTIFKYSGITDEELEKFKSVVM